MIVIRHGATNPDQADTEPLNIQNVDKQRQLNDQGRALAKQIGEAMRKLKIPVGEVQTSLFQRAVDTGTLLGFGDAKPTADAPLSAFVFKSIADPHAGRKQGDRRRAVGARAGRDPHADLAVPGSLRLQELRLIVT